ncbi:MAG: acetyltransferase [Bacilli bacterium]
MKKYGVEIVDRPKIRPTKKLDLSGKNGEEIIKSLTEKILIRHEKTFKSLEGM